MSAAFHPDPQANGHGDPQAVDGFRVVNGEPPPSVEDVACAVAVLRMARGHHVTSRSAQAVLRSEVWGDLAQSVLDTDPQSRQEWVGQWLAIHLGRHRDAAETMRRALDEARQQVNLEPDEPEAAEDRPKPFSLGVLGASEFARKAYTREWRVKGIAVKGRPGIIGGPQKTLKTSAVVDLFLSMASATLFLGEFEVPRPTKCLLISGESGEATLQELMRRVCRSKGIEPEDVEGTAFWGFTLPQLSDPDQLAALGDFIRENGIEVVIIDPLYLCLIGAGRRVDPSNLFDVGPLLKTITETCLDAGADPWLVHHFRKNRESPYGPPEMEDLAFAGIQEFARQWILLCRREKYEPGSGDHRLWISVGGSDGHSGEWALDVREGVIGDDWRDREWQVSIAKATEARTEAKQQAESAKTEKTIERDKAKDYARERKMADDAETALATIKAQGPLTRSRWMDCLGWGRTRFGPALARLENQGRVRQTSVPVTGSGTRKWTQSGYEFVTDTIGEPGENQPRTTPDNPGQNENRPALESSQSNPGQTGGNTPLGGIPPCPSLVDGSKSTPDVPGSEAPEPESDRPGLEDGDEGEVD